MRNAAAGAALLGVGTRVRGALGVGLGVLASLGAGLGVGAGQAEAQVGCRFVLGFAQVRDMVGAPTVGDCLEDEHYNPENGDSLQRTSRGLLVWRKADNFTAFTDGYRTWVNGPRGLQQRLNGERFDWESPTGPGAPIAPGAPAAPEAPGAAAGVPAVPEAVARGAREEAARRLGVAPEAIALTAAQPVDWPDTALGCPERGRAYAQVIVEGYRVTARAGDRTVEVHTDGRGRAVSC